MGKGSGRLKEIYYTNEKLSELLNISRENLNYLLKIENNLTTCLLTGLILKIEKDLKFSKISEYFKNEKIEIDLNIKEIDFSEKHFILERNQDLIEYGFSFIKSFNISYKHLNLFIEERNLFIHKYNKLLEEFRIYKTVEEL